MKRSNKRLVIIMKGRRKEKRNCDRVSHGPQNVQGALRLHLAKEN